MTLKMCGETGLKESSDIGLESDVSIASGISSDTWIRLKLMVSTRVGAWDRGES